MGPLDGIRVLDLSTVILGPMTGQYLGDMGADVIKIEAPEGDVTRSIGPRRSDGMGALFLANNRNKRSVVLDLKTAAGQAALHRLAAGADVLLHSIRSDAAARIGLAYPALAAANPRLVYCHVRGFQDDGPYGGRAAYDDIIQALSGLAMLQKIAAGGPRYVPSIIADKVTAVHAAYAIALALFHRERTGQGQEVGVPMMETMVAFNMAEHLGGAVFEPAVGSMGYEPIRQGMRRPFPTRDGHLCLLPYTDRHWARFFELAARPDLAADPRLRDDARPPGRTGPIVGGGGPDRPAPQQRRVGRAAGRVGHPARGAERSGGPAGRPASGRHRLLADAGTPDGGTAAAAREPDPDGELAPRHPPPAATPGGAHRRGVARIRPIQPAAGK